MVEKKTVAVRLHKPCIALGSLVAQGHGRRLSVAGDWAGGRLVRAAPPPSAFRAHPLTTMLFVSVRVGPKPVLGGPARKARVRPARHSLACSSL